MEVTQIIYTVNSMTALGLLALIDPTRMSKVQVRCMVAVAVILFANILI